MLIINPEEIKYLEILCVNKYFIYYNDIKNILIKKNCLFNCLLTDIN